MATGTALALLLPATACAMREAVEPAPEAEAVPTLSATLLEGLEAPSRDQIVRQRRLVAQYAAPEAPDAEALGPAYGELGMLYLAYGFREAAVPALANAQRWMPVDPRWPYYLGYVHQQAGRNDEALPEFLRAAELKLDSVPTQIRLAQVFRGLGEPSRAKDALTLAILEDPRSAAAISLSGEIAAAEGDHAAAIGHFLDALEIQPGANSLYTHLGQSYQALGETAQSQQALQRRGEVRVRLEDPWLEALESLKLGSNVLLARGAQLLNAGEDQAAAEVFRQITEAEPDNAAAYASLGAALIRINDLSAAKAALERAVSLDPDDSKTQFNLGQLRLRAGDDAGAEAAFRRALELDPGNPDAPMQLAMILRRSERCAEAVGFFDQALAHAQDPASPRLQQAVCLAHIGEFADAIARMEASLVAEPEQPIYMESMIRLLAAAPDVDPADRARALSLAETLSTRRRDATALDALAMALAANGRFSEAAEIADEALALVESEPGLEGFKVFMEGNQARYRQGRAPEGAWPDALLQR